MNAPSTPPSQLVIGPSRFTVTHGHLATKVAVIKLRCHLLSLDHSLWFFKFAIRNSKLLPHAPCSMPKSLFPLKLSTSYDS